MVDRIEKIENGLVTKSAERYHRDGGEFFECFEPGETRNPRWFLTLDEVANFLREEAKQAHSDGTRKRHDIKVYSHWR